MLTVNLALYHAQLYGGGKMPEEVYLLPRRARIAESSKENDKKQCIHDNIML